MNEFLSSIRNAHAALVLISFVVAAFAIAPNDFQRYKDAEAEARNMISLTPDSYASYLTSLSTDNENNRELAEYYRENGISVAPMFTFDHPLMLDWPGGLEPTIKQMTEWLPKKRQLYDVATGWVPFSPDDDRMVLISLVKHFRSLCRCSDVSVYDAKVSRDRDREGTGDTYFLDRPASGNKSGVVLVEVYYKDSSGHDNYTELTRDDLELVTASAENMPAAFYAMRWLQKQPFSSTLDLSVGGSLFSSLTPFWDQIADQTPTAAARYLAERAEASHKAITLGGVAVDTRVLLIGGPAAILVATLILLSALQMANGALERSSSAVVSLYPWPGLFTNFASDAILVCSIAVLPVGADISLITLSWSGWSWSVVFAIASTVVTTFVDLFLIIAIYKIQRRFRLAQL